MGRILPVRSRGGVPPPFSQPPREPTFPAPTKVEFDSMSIRDLLAYVLPIMGYIVKDLYTPIVKDMDDWYGDPAKRSLWGKSVRYGMFDRSSETDILVHEVVRILLGQTRPHSDLDANGEAGDDNRSDGAINAILPDNVSQKTAFSVFIIF